MSVDTLAGGHSLVCGPVVTSPIGLEADTYYKGMPLKYAADVSVGDITGTGNGTVTLLSADKSLPVGDYTLLFTGALAADLKDSDGNILKSFVFADGAATKCFYNGLKFTVTDGSTAFVATATFVITVAAGVYEYNIVSPEAIYNGVDERVLSASGVANAIVFGEIVESGLRSDANAVLTLTDADRVKYRENGIYPQAG